MKKSEKIILAVFVMFIGVVLVAIKGKFIGILATVVGGGLIVLAVVDILQGGVPPALVKAVSGALVILCGWVAVRAVIYVIAAALLIVGALLLYDKIKRGVKCSLVWQIACEYAVPSLCAIIGFLLFFHSVEWMNVIFVISGILTLLEGGLILLNAFTEN